MIEVGTAAIKSNKEAFRGTAERGIAQAKGTYEKAIVAGEQASDLLKNTCAIAAKGTADYNLKIIEIACTNANTAFEYAEQLMGVKSLSDFVALSTAHARKQFDTMIAQTASLTELAQKVTTQVTQPLKTGVAMAFNNNVADLSASHQSDPSTSAAAAAGTLSRGDVFNPPQRSDLSGDL
jgi:phasin